MRVVESSVISRQRHIASRVDPALLEKFYLKRAEALSMKRLSSAIDKGIVASSRVGADGSEYLFFMNFDSAKRAFAAPEGCKDLLTGKAVSGTVELDGRSGITLVR